MKITARVANTQPVFGAQPGGAAAPPARAHARRPSGEQPGALSFAPEREECLTPVRQVQEHYAAVYVAPGPAPQPEADSVHRACTSSLLSRSQGSFCEAEPGAASCFSIVAE